MSESFQKPHNVALLSFNASYKTVQSPSEFGTTKEKKMEQK